jgi:hypothetical protein
MPPSRIATLLRLFQQTPPQGVADNEEVGNALAQLAQNIRPTGARNGLEEFAQLPGHALANSIEGAGALIQPEKIAQGIRGVIQDPQPALDGIKGFASEVAERPVALLEQLSLSDAIPGLTAGKFLGAASAVAGAVPPGGNKFLKKLGKSTDNLTPTQRRLRELAEGVENPGALERKRLESQGGDIAGVSVLLKELEELRGHMQILPGETDAAFLQRLPQLELQEKELANKIGIASGNISKAKLTEGSPADAIAEAKKVIDNRAASLAQFDNLDPIEKARLDRAVQQGFDIDAYHGTKGDIQSFDPGLLGATTGAPSARVGFFFAAEPETAASYARSADFESLRPDEFSDMNKALEVKLEAIEAEKNAAIAKLPESVKEQRRKGINTAPELQNILQDYNKKKGEASRALVAIERGEDSFGENILPVKIRLQNPLVHDFGGGSYREVSYKDLLDQAQRDGKDGAIFRNTRDGGPVTDIYVVFEPSQVRSKYAAFDPSRASYGDITATMPPLLFPIGIGAAAAAFSADRE